MRRGSWVAVALLLLSGLGAPVSVPLGKGVTTTLPAVTAFQGGKPMVVLPLEWFPMALGPVEIPIPKAELSIIIE